MTSWPSGKPRSRGARRGPVERKLQQSDKLEAACSVWIRRKLAELHQFAGFARRMSSLNAPDCVDLTERGNFPHFPGRYRSQVTSRALSWSKSECARIRRLDWLSMG
jgi:hypothetical protein